MREFTYLQVNSKYLDLICPLGVDLNAGNWANRIPSHRQIGNPKDAGNPPRPDRSSSLPEALNQILEKCWIMSACREVFHPNQF